jgi:predicted small metal-binding protein
MMKLSCKDMDPDGDSFEAHGTTPTEVAKKMMAHIKSEHPDEMKGMSDAEMMKMLEAKVHS